MIARFHHVKLGLAVSLGFGCLAPAHARAQVSVSLKVSSAEGAALSPSAGGSRLFPARALAGAVSPSDTLTEDRGSRGRHVVIGTLGGGVVGGLIGGATAGGNTGTSFDPLVRTAGVLGGALLGAVAGGIAGVFWPHR